MSSNYYKAEVSDVEGCEINEEVQKLYKDKELSEDKKTLKLVGCYDYDGPDYSLGFDGYKQYVELAKIKDGLLWKFKDKGERTTIKISKNKKWHKVVSFNENLQSLDYIYYDFKNKLERKEAVDLKALIESLRVIIAMGKHADINTYGLTEIDLLNRRKESLLIQVEHIKSEIKAKKRKESIEPELF
jgi:hypothetical protein